MKNYLPDFDDHFPEKKVNVFYRNKLLDIILKNLREYKNDPNFGDLASYPHEYILEVWKKMLPFNPNNSGNWSLKKYEYHGILQKTENALVRKMADLYGSRKSIFEGYVTSGATEGNIYACWVGRKYLQVGTKPSKIILLMTDLTHYSVRKAADVVNVDTYKIAVNSKTWSIDPEKFYSAVTGLYKKGYRGFMISLTHGYTSTGTSDDSAGVVAKIRKLKKEFEDIRFFVWIDAAFMGLVRPFSDPNYKPLNLSEIQIYITDFHKFGFVPLSCGVVLYRKDLRKLIEKPVDYLSYSDSTLLGSRSGISAASAFFVIMTLGKKGFREIIWKNFKLKDAFLKDAADVFGKALAIINDPNSLAVGLMLTKYPDENAVGDFEEKYNIKFRNIKILTDKGILNTRLAKASFLKLN